MMLMEEEQMQYPLVIKILQASRCVYSHSFYVVSSDNGLFEALKFEGFQGERILF